MSLKGQLRPIEITPGVQPATDKTKLATSHYTFSDKIRFTNGKPEKIGGWVSTEFDYGDTISGTVRSLFTDIINGKYYSIVGSNEKLYALIGSILTNITPFVTSSVAAANSLDTHYATLGNNPMSATIGSMEVVVTDSEASKFQVGVDTVTISGATTFAGLGIGDINGDFIIRAIGVGNYTINVGAAATSTASGGGASVVRTSGLITLNDVAHGQLDGDRVKISGAATTGGILNTEINLEFIIRNVAADTFDFMTAGTATSSVSAGGGASTVYFVEIPDGPLNESAAQGYGAGLYGVGLYGTALISAASRTYPRTWFFDRFANTIIATPGNQTGLYQWAGNVSTAPVLITNAPTAINYAFVSNNIIVTFGAGGTENRILSSDFDITVWTSSSTNQVFDDDIEGAGRLTSHVPVEDYSLIFTEYQTYTFRYIGFPFIWEVKKLDDTVGIIAPMARCSAKGIAYWMGTNNFYMYRGGTVEVIPANTQHESTILNYVFNDINWGQKSKFFAWFNKEFQEVWFHYASADSNECDRIARVNVNDFIWTPDTLERTASEYPNVKLINPRLFNVGTLYQHELGTDDDGEPMAWTLTSNQRFYGKNNTNLNAIIPDSIQQGDITLDVKSKLFPQSPLYTYNQSFTIGEETQRVAILNSGRFYEYTWSGEVLGQSFLMGEWLEEVQQGSTE